MKETKQSVADELDHTQDAPAAPSRLATLRGLAEELFWKYRYAKYMNKVSKCGWSFAWYSAGVAVDDLDWQDCDPGTLASDEMSYWE